MTEHILVVDDEPDMQHIIQLAFKKDIRRQDYHFSFALNGSQALRILEEDPEITLVLTDINMPEMDGLTLLRKIKALNELVRAVVVSAYGDMANIRTAMNCGAFDFLTKPIDLKDLKITVRKTLEEITLLKRALQDRDQYVAIKKELEIARQLQLSMMPKLPLYVADYQLDGQITLSSEVGGDFIDLIELSDGEFLLVLGDCSGHGLSSALVMSAIRHSLRTLATQIKDYHDFIPSLNQIVYREFKSKASYATMVFVQLSKNNPKIRLLRAGHELPYLRRNGRFQEPDWRGGLPVGIFPKRYKDEWISFELQPGDELFLYTDGIVDGMPENLEVCDLLADAVAVDEKIRDNSFFSFLSENLGWKGDDDASLLRLRRMPNP